MHRNISKFYYYYFFLRIQEGNEIIVSPLLLGGTLISNKENEENEKKIQIQKTNSEKLAKYFEKSNNKNKASSLNNGTTSSISLEYIELLFDFECNKEKNNEIIVKNKKENKSLIIEKKNSNDFNEFDLLIENEEKK